MVSCLARFTIEVDVTAWRLARVTDPGRLVVAVASPWCAPDILECSRYLTGEKTGLAVQIDVKVDCGHIHRIICLPLMEA